jgi:hypothetical protein
MMFSADCLLFFNAIVEFLLRKCKQMFEIKIFCERQHAILVRKYLRKPRKARHESCNLWDFFGEMFYAAIAPVIEEDPCDPNPCGPYSNPPRNSGDRCDCTCLPGMIGQPPNCRPECQLN